jgi:hypothetical protein
LWNFHIFPLLLFQQLILPPPPDPPVAKPTPHANKERLKVKFWAFFTTIIIIMGRATNNLSKIISNNLSLKKVFSCGVPLTLLRPLMMYYSSLLNCYD